MLRFLAGGVAALLMAAAGWVLFNGRAATDPVLPAAPARPSAQGAAEESPLPDTVPEASPRTREEKRFGRYDKDRDGKITRDEYLVSRRKAYARLDRDGNGQLSFDEWAAKTVTKFTTADRDHSNAMNAAEFATTAVKRSARPRPNCPPPSRASETSDD